MGIRSDPGTSTDIDKTRLNVTANRVRAVVTYGFSSCARPCLPQGLSFCFPIRGTIALALVELHKENGAVICRALADRAPFCDRIKYVPVDLLDKRLKPKARVLSPLFFIQKVPHASDIDIDEVASDLPQFQIGLVLQLPSFSAQRSGREQHDGHFAGEPVSYLQKLSNPGLILGIEQPGELQTQPYRSSVCAKPIDGVTAERPIWPNKLVIPQQSTLADKL